jgi:hypothetical protein
MGINFNFRQFPTPHSDIPEMRNTFPDLVKTFTPLEAKQAIECVLFQAN